MSLHRLPSMTVPTLPQLDQNRSTATGVVIARRAEDSSLHVRRRWDGDAPLGQVAADAAAPGAVPSAAPGLTPSSTPSDSDEPYRVLVVEDDPSQALFAESVLRGAGIQAQAVRISADVLPQMEAYRPDLVLMDLHMPGMSGNELTALIRAHPEFAHMPIVFLTGDQDPERQFEALENGADDFLSKPIRPRHLMAAVHSRIKRARALAGQRANDSGRNPQTGLFHRPHLLRSIAAGLAGKVGGAGLFVEIQNASGLREGYGYAGFEQLMHDVGRRLAQLATPFPCARLNDNAFLVFAAGVDDERLGILARELRDGIRHPCFDYDGMPQRLRTAIGLAALKHFTDLGDLIDSLEQVARAARSEPLGMAGYTPTATNKEAADSLVAAMREGLRENAFELAFQPVVAVTGGEDAQFQTLLRMRDAAGTLHRAGTLVPAAEAAGLIPQIDRWVLGKAIDLLHRRREEQRTMRLFVSQSPRTMARDMHGEWLLDMLTRHGIEGPSLVIDLRLEHALLHSTTVRQFSDLLVPAGVQLCLSQYIHGTQADALLEQLPLGYLRLAPRYSNAHCDRALRDELRQIVDRAHRLNLRVIGPQVENAQGAATLWMSGIDLIQGNLVQQADDALDFDFAHAVL